MNAWLIKRFFKRPFSLGAYNTNSLYAHDVNPNPIILSFTMRQAHQAYNKNSVCT